MVLLSVEHVKVKVLLSNQAQLMGQPLEKIKIEKIFFSKWSFKLHKNGPNSKWSKILKFILEKSPFYSRYSLHSQLCNQPSDDLDVEIQLHSFQLSILLEI